MHIVIAGAGEIGTVLAKWFVSSGHEIAVIEQDRETGRILDETLGAVSILGDPTDESVQAKAGTNRADAFIATTGKDDVNLAACQLAKHHFGVRRTISTVNKPDRSELFEALGIDVAIDVSGLIANRIQEAIDSDNVAFLLPAGTDGKSVVAMRIPQSPNMTERSLVDINLPPEILVSLIISKDGSYSVPTDETMIQSGDEILIVASPHDVEDLKERLTLQTGE